MWEGSKKIKIV